jgi:hypothetical protein
VTVSGTTGVAGYGAYAAGPAFQSIAETALRLRGVQRDVPEEIEAIEQKEIAAKEKLKAKQKPKETDDGDALAYLSIPLTDDEMKQASGETDAAQTAPDVKGPKVPDFVGETVKNVMEEATAKGIDVEMLGDGMARAQDPPAGSALVPGEHIRVRFMR